MFKNFGLIDKIFGKKQIVISTADETELFNYMPLGKVGKLVDYILAVKRRAENIRLFDPFTYTYNGIVPNPKYVGESEILELTNSDDKLLCSTGVIVWGFENRNYIGGYTNTYQILSLPHKCHRIMDLDINIIEALQCTLNNAQQRYNNNIALLEIPEFSLKGCKISGM